MPKPPKAGNQLPGVVLAFSVICAVVFLLYRDGMKETARYLAEQAAERESRSTVLSTGDLAEMLALCRPGFDTAVGAYSVPVAVAWTKRGVDAYFYDGTDASSLRQVRCDAEGVSRGPRVEHPLAAHLPAEASTESEEDAHGEWQAALERYSKQYFEPQDVAFELVRHPATGAALSRRWKALPEGAASTLDPEDAPVFGFLPAKADFRPVPPASAPALKALPRRHWLAQWTGAFALVRKELPKGARISELSLQDDEIEVQIDFPTPAFDGKPDAPYGDKDFDEYGVADTSFWYPREDPGFGCARGRTVAEVETAFIEAVAVYRSQPLLRAWYSCSPAYSNKRDGVWHLVPKSGS
jgi:hypothetical protein